MPDIERNTDCNRLPGGLGGGELGSLISYTSPYIQFGAAELSAVRQFNSLSTAIVSYQEIVYGAIAGSAIVLSEFISLLLYLQKTGVGGHASNVLYSSSNKTVQKTSKSVHIYHPAVYWSTVLLYLFPIARRIHTLFFIIYYFNLHSFHDGVEIPIADSINSLIITNGLSCLCNGDILSCWKGIWVNWDLNRVPV